MNITKNIKRLSNKFLNMFPKIKTKHRRSKHKKSKTRRRRMKGG